MGGEGAYYTTLIHSQSLPLLSHLQLPQLPVCTSLVKTGKRQGGLRQQGQAGHTKQTEPCLWYLQSILKYW